MLGFQWKFKDRLRFSIRSEILNHYCFACHFSIAYISQFLHIGEDLIANFQSLQEARIRCSLARTNVSITSVVIPISMCYPADVHEPIVRPDIPFPWGNSLGLG